MGAQLLTYKKDDHSTAETSLPDYAHTANHCYKKWFGTDQVREDIKVKRKIGKIKSHDEISLLPSQIFILKDLMLIVDILDPQTNMRLEDFLETDKIISTISTGTCVQ